MERKLGINGVGNTGGSILVLMADAMSKGGHIPDVAVIHDIGRDAAQIVSEVNSGCYGLPPILLRREDDRTIAIDTLKIAVAPPAGLQSMIDWSRYGVWGVIEATGAILERAENERSHIETGRAQQVVITAPSANASAKTIVYGFNEQGLQPTDTVVDNGSCSSRACAHVLKAFLDDGHAFEGISLDILHPKTQRKRHEMLEQARRGKLGAEDLVVAKRGSGSQKVLQKLFGDRLPFIQAEAIETPTLDVSRCRMAIAFRGALTKAQVHDALTRASRDGILRMQQTPPTFQHIQNDPTNSVVLEDGIMQLSSTVWSIPMMFDNRYASANAALKLTEHIAALSAGE